VAVSAHTQQSGQVSQTCVQLT